MAHISIRVSEQEKAEIESMASKAKMSVSELVKERVLGTVDRSQDGDEPEEPEPEMVDLAPFVAKRESVPLAVAERWIRDGFVSLDSGGFEGEVCKSPRISKERLGDVIVGKETTRAEKKRQRESRTRRQEAAERHGVSVGWIGPDGEPMPGAPLGSIDHSKA